MLHYSPDLVPASSHVGPLATTLSAITEGRGEDLRVHGGLDLPCHLTIGQKRAGMHPLLRIFLQAGEAQPLLPAAEREKRGRPRKGPTNRRGDKRVEMQAANNGAESPVLTVLETGESSHWLIPARAARCQGISRRFGSERRALIGGRLGKQGEPRGGLLAGATLWRPVVECRAGIGGGGGRTLSWIAGCGGPLADGRTGGGARRTPVALPVWPPVGGGLVPSAARVLFWDLLHRVSWSKPRRTGVVAPYRALYASDAGRAGRDVHASLLVRVL